MGFNLPTTDGPWATSSAARRGKAARPAKANAATTEAAKRAEKKRGELIMGKRVGVENTEAGATVVKAGRAASGRRRTAGDVAQNLARLRPFVGPGWTWFSVP